MKARLLTLLLSWSFVSFSQKIGIKKTQLYIIGTVHFPTEKITADTIYNVLFKIKPDLILMEAGSQNFNNDYSFKKTYDENEWNACIKYKAYFRETDFRPYDIEQRNNKRKQLGINGDNPASTFIFLKDSLNELAKTQSEIWKRYTYLSDTLNYYSDKTLKEINCQATDNLVSERQFYQYRKLSEVINAVDIFYHIKGSAADTISLVEYNKKYCDFELKRNYEMAKNIVEKLRKYNGKKIVVLTGFYHRYALINLIRFKQEEYGFELKEFYE